MPLLQVAPIFSAPLERLVEFEALLRCLRRAVVVAALACGSSAAYDSAFDRFARKFAGGLCAPGELLGCVVAYSALAEACRSQAHYAVLQALDAFLDE